MDSGPGQAAHPGMTAVEDPATVMPGLDPGIHQAARNAFILMDCRVKPGNDIFGTANGHW
jgi:hypothetical protein